VRGITPAMNRTAIIAAAATAAALLVFVVVILVIDGSRSNTIADGVRIGRLDVGGMDRAQARSLVERKLAGSVGKRVRVAYEKQRFVLRPAVAKAKLDADASVDAALARSRQGNPFGRVLGGNDASGTVAPRISYSRAAVTGFAQRVAQRVNRSARDADIDWRNGKLDRTRAKPGVQVQQRQLVARLVSALAKPSKRAVAVPVRVTERPNRTFEDLAKRYPTVIAVDRDNKVLRLYKHLKLDKRYKIAVGQIGLETAAGRYKIQEKIVNPAWHVPDSSWAGALAGRTIPYGDPQNPLKARYMGFHDGQGIHGTAELSSLGTAASHGCIRMSVPAVKELYREVKVGTPVFLQ
jgi:lipoprotein-anchoring transpeptidase ErfK/SrfK